ncbi:MAG: hypothetical protein NC115_03845 [Bacteroidales bacterium]|nr:hypothetical protein [Bacteroidales bacterium]
MKENIGLRNVKEMSSLNYQTVVQSNYSDHGTIPDMYQEEKNANFFHITAKGLESELLFHDKEDFHKIINISAICAFDCNVSIVAYAHMSNHSHYVVFCETLNEAGRFMNRSKRMYSQFCRQKRGSRNLQRRTNTTIKPIETFQYLRNCIAYVLRNPVEAKIVRYADQYEWSSYKCYFKDYVTALRNYEPIQNYKKREIKYILGTHTDLKDSKLMIDKDGNIAPESFVASSMAESLFNNSSESLIRQILKINYYSIEFELTYNGTPGNNDIDLIAVAQRLANDWFKKELNCLSFKERIKLIGVLYKREHASQSQISRILNLPQKLIKRIISGE